MVRGTSDVGRATTRASYHRTHAYGSTDYHHASRGARARVPVRGVHARRALVQRHDRDDEDGLEGGARAPSGTSDDDEDDARRGGWG